MDQEPHMFLAGEVAAPRRTSYGRGMVTGEEAEAGQVTVLLRRMQAGDESARDALFAAAYPQLRYLAQARVRRGGRNVVIDTTSLVHECYLRFLNTGNLRAQDRRAFFAYASQVMRTVVVNTVRDRMREKRGGDWRPTTLSTQIAESVPEADETILKVHEALEMLKRSEPRLAQVAEMRYFGGYTECEIAETLEVTERTVQRDWKRARLILAAALS